MGLFDHLADGFGFVGDSGESRLRRNVRAGTRLLEQGNRTTARITGIRVVPGGEDSPDQHEFRLERPGSPAAGCRQQLGPLAPTFRLGAEVPVRYDQDGRVIIDTPALGGGDAWGYKALSDPPAEGIEDPGLRLDKERRKAVPATVTVLHAQRASFFGAFQAGIDLRVRVEGDGVDPHEADVKREWVPFYASHLVAEGTVLPGLARPGRPGKVRIDWPAAAVADPGVGRPPAPAVAPAEEAALVTGVASPASADWSEEALFADDLGLVDGVSFDAWVAVEAGLVRDRVRKADHDAYAQRHGVPAGGWTAARKGWQQRMMVDPRIGARFGAAYQASLKQH